MENFFYEDRFFLDLEELAKELDIDEDNINELRDDWEVIIELSYLEPIFKVDANNICQLLINSYEDRLPEDFDDEKNVLKALKETIDFEKLKEKLPKVYYPSNDFYTIKKSDLEDLFS